MENAGRRVSLSGTRLTGTCDPRHNGNEEKCKCPHLLVVGYFENTIFLNAKIPDHTPPTKPRGAMAQIGSRPPLVILPRSRRTILITVIGRNMHMTNIVIPIPVDAKRRSVNFT